MSIIFIDILSDVMSDTMGVMSTTLTKRRLADMYALIPGIVKAFTYVPRIINAADCPAVVIQTGQSQDDEITTGENDVMETRFYTATLYLDYARFGTESQSEDALDPFFDAVRDYFLARPGLELASASEPQIVVYKAFFRGDSGFNLVQYATGGEAIGEFAATRFRHEVLEWHRVDYQD